MILPLLLRTLAIPARLVPVSRFCGNRSLTRRGVACTSSSVGFRAGESVTRLGRPQPAPSLLGAAQPPAATLAGLILPVSPQSLTHRRLSMPATGGPRTG